MADVSIAFCRLVLQVVTAQSLAVVVAVVGLVVEGTSRFASCGSSLWS